MRSRGAPLAGDVARIDKKMARGDLGRKPAEANPERMARVPTVRPLSRPRLEELPLDWYAGDLDVSLFWDALSAVFPEGERFFVRAVKAHRDAALGDAELLARIDAFVGQEAAHGFAHMTLNQHVAGAGRVEERLRWILRDGAEALLTPRQRLGVTCALEHFTALLAAQLLEDPRHRAAIDERVLPLWLWHAFEEVEHADVAFDVYLAAGGTLAERRATMALTTALFVAFMLWFYGMLAADVGRARRPASWWRVARFLWLDPGLTRRLLPDYLAYYRAGFHPSEKRVDALLERWRERLFGDGGIVPLRAARA